MNGNLTRWERLEAWLFDNEANEFNSQALVDELGVTRQEASRMIAAYLDAQRRPGSETLFVLKRTGRTSQSIWSVGQRTADARVICGTLFEDVQAKVRRAFEPDLKKLRERNPHAARFVEARLGAVIDGALKVLAASLEYEED